MLGHILAQLEVWQREEARPHRQIDLLLDYSSWYLLHLCELKIDVGLLHDFFFIFFVAVELFTEKGENKGIEIL